MNYRIVPLLWLLTVPAFGADLATFANSTAGHYQVFAQSGNQMAVQVNGYMNALLKLYTRYFASWEFKDGARVVVFANRDEFREYSRASTGLTHAGLTGYCHWKTDEAGNQFYELVTFEHAGLWAVLAHEGLHQFLGYELGATIPLWLNEGLAQYFETCTVDKAGKFVVGGVDRDRLAAAQALARHGKWPALAALLSWDRQAFYAQPEVSYPASWALVHFLMSRDKGTGMRRYLGELKGNANSLASFRRRFGRESAAWEAELADYVWKLRAPAN